MHNGNFVNKTWAEDHFCRAFEKKKKKEAILLITLYYLRWN